MKHLVTNCGDCPFRGFDGHPAINEPYCQLAADIRAAWPGEAPPENCPLRKEEHRVVLKSAELTALQDEATRLYRAIGPHLSACCDGSNLDRARGVCCQRTIDRGKRYDLAFDAIRRAGATTTSPAGIYEAGMVEIAVSMMGRPAAKDLGWI